MFSQCGLHNIDNQLIFKSNLQLIFHDSCGFKSGSKQNLDSELFHHKTSWKHKLVNGVIVRLYVLTD